MQTIRLGDTGIEVSALCLGVLYYGNRIDLATSFRLLDLYAEAGGTFFDTANIYSCWIPGFQGGESETALGAWMRERGNRLGMFVATKLGFAYQDVPRGLTAALIQAECEKSLRRLQTDVIDLYYAHVDDAATPLEESLEALDRLVKSGKVRFIGASNFQAGRLAQSRLVSHSRGWARYCCIQQRYTFLQPVGTFGDQIAVDADLLTYVRKEDLTLLAYSPLLNGAYVRGDRAIPVQYHSPEKDARLAALRKVADQTGATVNQVIYAWMLRHDPPVIPLMAASTEAQMAENLASLHVKLGRDHLALLRQPRA